MKEETLSDKIHSEDNYNSFIPTDDVKDFIKKLKEIVNDTDDKGSVDVTYLFNLIDTLAGKELI